MRGLATGAFYGAILITAINGLGARIGFGWVVDLLVFGVLGFLLVSLFNGGQDDLEVPVIELAEDASGVFSIVDISPPSRWSPAARRSW